MSTQVSSDVQADLQALSESLAAGTPIDPELARRVHERAERAREEIRRTHGVLNIGVDLIREIRDTA